MPIEDIILKKITQEHNFKKCFQFEIFENGVTLKELNLKYIYIYIYIYIHIFRAFLCFADRASQYNLSN